MSKLPAAPAAEGIMVFAPHPDDDIIGCGGSIAQHVQQGRSVRVVYLTSGDAGSLTCPKPELARLRRNEAVKAATVLGLCEADLIFLNNPDGYLPYSAENLVLLINLIRQLRPNLVYLPHDQEQSRDHRVTHELVLEACRRAGGPWFQECCGEPWSPESLLGYEVWNPLPTVAYSEDITDFIDLKLQALQQHQTQLEAVDYAEAIKGLNRYRGIMTGKGNYCECFQVLNIAKVV
jgi:LmbE family N-acetylglucosaminyl deacetylase